MRSWLATPWDPRNPWESQGGAPPMMVAVKPGRPMFANMPSTPFQGWPRSHFQVCVVHTIKRAEHPRSLVQVGEVRRGEVQLSNIKSHTALPLAECLEPRFRKAPECCLDPQPVHMTSSHSTAGMRRDGAPLSCVSCIMTVPLTPACDWGVEGVQAQQNVWSSPEDGPGWRGPVMGIGFFQCFADFP